METILNLLAPIVDAYSGIFPPVLVKIFIIIGSLRIFVKPIMSMISAYVQFTPKTEDDGIPAKIEGNKIYKAVIYALDWFASIKVKK